MSSLSFFSATLQPADFVTIGLLVMLEGLLSADNAMVLAVLVLGLPKADQRKALRYGILGAFAFRSIATLLAAYLIRLGWVKLGGRRLSAVPGGAPLHAERRRRGAADAAEGARACLGLTAFWATVVKVELTDIVFAIDSILVAVAMSPKLWVILTGGILGIVMMRLVIGQLLAHRGALSAARGRRVRHHRVGRHQAPDRVPARRATTSRFEMPKWLSLGLIVVIFGARFCLRAGAGAARPVTPTEPDADSAARSDERRTP